ncbi:MAG: hypothetical protein HW416_1249 [Chloroflexi bacterium]|nr:hypothetical protein [Chloroflexota bacterium]
MDAVEVWRIVDKAEAFVAGDDREAVLRWLKNMSGQEVAAFREVLVGGILSMGLPQIRAACGCVMPWYQARC